MNQVPADRESARFYLKHQRLVDEWIEAREDAREEADRFFCSLAPMMEREAKALRARHWVQLEDDYRQLMWYDAAWAEPKGEPRVAIGIEWHRGETDFHGAWFGICIWDRNTAGPIRNAIAAAELTEQWKKEKQWPAFLELVPSRDDYWDHLDEFRSRILEQVGAAWSELRSVVDDVVGKRKDKKAT